MYNTDTYTFKRRVEEEVNEADSLEELKRVVVKLLCEIIDEIPTHQDPSEE